MCRKSFVWAVGLCLMMSFPKIHAGKKLSLMDITRGEFRSEVMQAVCPLADGETYGQMSSDGKRVESYSFRTGQRVAVLFDAAKRMLIGEIATINNGNLNVGAFLMANAMMVA